MSGRPAPRPAGEDAGLRIPVRVLPRSPADGVAGVRDGALLVRVTAAPVNGAANEAVIRVVAHELGVARASVGLVSGARARTKMLAIRGVSRDLVRRRWPDLGV